jgi:hypothetical protein
VFHEEAFLPQLAEDCQVWAEPTVKDARQLFHSILLFQNLLDLVDVSRNIFHHLVSLLDLDDITMLLKTLRKVEGK